MRLGHKAVLLLLRAYQLTLSSVIGRQCRYLPTCSDYTLEAVVRYGVWRGSCLGAARICRCHPWGGSGYDPVPPSLPAGRPVFGSSHVGRDTEEGQERARSCAERP